MTITNADISAIVTHGIAIGYIQPTRAHNYGRMLRNALEHALRYSKPAFATYRVKAGAIVRR